MDYLKIAGSLAMWLCVVPAILVVVVQAAMFARKAYKCGLEIGMTKAQLKSAIRASAVSSTVSGHSFRHAGTAGHRRRPHLLDASFLHRQRGV